MNNRKKINFFNNINNTLIDSAVKGIKDIDKIKIQDIKKQKWNILKEDVQFPILTIKKSFFNKNILSMHKYVKANKVFLAPHIKTSMSPQIIQQIFNLGCWGFTVANNQQLSVLLKMGIRKIIFANLITNQSNIDNLFQLINQYKDIQIYICVDSIFGINLLKTLSKKLNFNRVIKILIEVGYQNSRSGIRNIKSLNKILDSLRILPVNFKISGILFYEGASAVNNYSISLKRVEKCIKLAFNCLNFLISNNIINNKECIISGGGSEYFDLVVDSFKKNKKNKNFKFVIRPGSYIAYGHGYYLSSLNKINDRKKIIIKNKKINATDLFQPSLELWAHVISQQDSGKAILNFGKRDVSFDLGYPIPLLVYRNGKILHKSPYDKNIVVYKLNDQHAFIKFSKNYNIEVGDLVKFGVSHPCITIDKWKIFYMINDNNTIVEAFKTFF